MATTLKAVLLENVVLVHGAFYGHYSSDIDLSTTQLTYGLPPLYSLGLAISAFVHLLKKAQVESKALMPGASIITFSVSPAAQNAASSD